MTTPAWVADGSLVQERGNPPVYVMAGGAKLHVPSAAEFDAMGYQWQNVTELDPGTLAATPVVPRDMTLLRERTTEAAWVMWGGDRVQLPTVSAVVALFGQLTTPIEVPAGSLEGFGVLPMPSAALHPSRTPPSMVFPPSRANGWMTVRGANTAKWWPRRITSAVSLPNGVSLVTLRGWLVSPPDPHPGGDNNTSDPDVGFAFEPDPAWLDQMGVDWRSVFLVGDILSTGRPLDQTNLYNIFVNKKSSNE